MRLSRKTLSVDLPPTFDLELHLFSSQTLHLRVADKLAWPVLRIEIRLKLSNVLRTLVALIVGSTLVSLDDHIVPILLTLEVALKLSG